MFTMIRASVKLAVLALAVFLSVPFVAFAIVIVAQTIHFFNWLLERSI